MAAVTSDFFMAGFAGGGVASREALLATARWPRPSRLAQPLALKGKTAEAAESLALRSVGDLLEYTPRARREARTVAALDVGDTATVVVDGPLDHPAAGPTAWHAPDRRGDGG